MVDLVVDNKFLYVIFCLICLIEINFWKKFEFFSLKRLKYLFISILFMVCFNNVKNDIKGKMFICFVFIYWLWFYELL